MSTLQTTNIDFESTGNNQLTYASNSVTLRVGGVGVMTVNTTALTVNVASAITPGALIANGTISVNTLTTSSNSSLIVFGQITTTGAVSPTALAANTVGWAPGITNEAIVRFSGNNNVTLPIYVYGMTAGVNGQIIVLSNIGTKAVIFENESPSETTAGNKFSFPESVILNGYQSMTVIYDGTAARWKPTDFSVQTFYKSFLTKGFFFNGYSLNPGTPDLKCRFTHDTETMTFVPTLALSGTDRNAGGAVGNEEKAFLSGGGSGLSLNPLFVSACRLTYSNESVVSVPGANLSQARARILSAGNRCKGFFVGGLVTTPTPTSQTTADRTTYSSEVTAVVPGASLTAGARTGTGGAGNLNKGFITGSAATPTLCRITYASETTAALSSSLTTARSAAVGIGNECKGFFSGGITSPTTVSAVTDRVTYATETVSAVPGANLTQAKMLMAVIGNNNKGFIATGTSTVSGCDASNTINKVTYSTETTALSPVTTAARIICAFSI